VLGHVGLGDPIKTKCALTYISQGRSFEFVYNAKHI
jgi:hypothetical protein